MQTKGLVELQTFTLLLGLISPEDYEVKTVMLERLAVAIYKRIGQLHVAEKKIATNLQLTLRVEVVHRLGHGGWCPRRWGCPCSAWGLKDPQSHQR